MDHPRSVIWIETANRIEPRVATNLWSLTNVASYHNARSVVVHRLSKTAALVRLFSGPMPPHTAEACDRYQHVLSASQLAVVVALGIQLLLQIVDVRHQLGICAALIGRQLAVPRCAGFAPQSLQSNRHLGHDLRLLPQLFPCKVSLPCRHISLACDTGQLTLQLLDLRTRSRDRFAILRCLNCTVAAFNVDVDLLCAVLVDPAGIDML